VIKLNDIWDFIRRNLVWIALVIVGLIFIQPTFELLHKLALIAVLEGLALGLSGIALFVYTKVKVARKLIDKDENQSDAEILAYSIITASIFVGVHILVGLTYYILSLEIL
jgi:threonine/homoserine efflux transporter RhtA